VLFSKGVTHVNNTCFVCTILKHFKAYFKHYFKLQLNERQPHVVEHEWHVPPPDGGWHEGVAVPHGSRLKLQLDAWMYVAMVTRVHADVRQVAVGWGRGERNIFDFLTLTESYVS